MKWHKLSGKKPRNGRVILVVNGGALRVGKYDPDHPFGPVAIDYSIGKWWQFELWAYVSLPKIDQDQADKGAE